MRSSVRLGLLGLLFLQVACTSTEVPASDAGAALPSQEAASYMDAAPSIVDSGPEVDSSSAHPKDAGDCIPSGGDCSTKSLSGGRRCCNRGCLVEVDSAVCE
jgi:hypothetical protein